MPGLFLKVAELRARSPPHWSWLPDAMPLETSGDRWLNMASEDMRSNCWPCAEPGLAWMLTAAIMATDEYQPSWNPGAERSPWDLRSAGATTTGSSS